MDALTKARKALASRAEDKRLFLVPGLADDLRAIEAALGELQSSIATLAAHVLRKHYWPRTPMHAAQFEALARMGAEAATVHRVGTKEGECDGNEK